MHCVFSFYIDSKKPHVKTTAEEKQITPLDQSKLHILHSHVAIYRKEGWKCFISRRTQHILFTVIWRQTYGKGPLRKREETFCHHMGYSFRLAARVLLYASSHRQDNTYHGLCYTSRGALAGTRVLYRYSGILFYFLLQIKFVKKPTLLTVYEDLFYECLISQILKSSIPAYGKYDGTVD